MMRKKMKWALLLLALSMALFSSIPALAEETGVDAGSKVYDYAGLFSDEEESALQSRAEQILRDWDMDMVFLTTESTGGMEARRYAADFYERNGFGGDGEHSGIIMIVDMGGRDAQIVTCGKAVTVFTDYYIGRIWNGMRDSLSDGEYFDAMDTLCDSVEYYNAEYLEYQENPSYVSQYMAGQRKQKSALALGVAALVSAVIAGIGVSFLRKGNKNVKPYTDGRAYLKPNGMTLAIDKNTFASTHTSRTPIPKNNNHNNNNTHGGGSWGGRSSTFRSGGGRSFGGGGGRF